MSASAAAPAAAHLRWVEEPCKHAGAFDLTLYIDGQYFGMVCTATARFGEWDGWMSAVIGETRHEHFKTRDECVAFMEFAAHGGERGQA